MAQPNGPGKDCVDCGLGAVIGGAIATIAQNWDNWRIKDWTKKNLNFNSWGRSWNRLWGKNGGKEGPAPPANVSKYGNIQMPTQHSSFGFNWTYLSEGKPGERFIYDYFNNFNIIGQTIIGRSVGDYSM